MFLPTVPFAGKPIPASGNPVTRADAVHAARQQRAAAKRHILEVEQELH